MSESKNDIQVYFQAAKKLKTAILKSRFIAGKLLNKEMLVLYYFVGKYVSINTRGKNWGTGAIKSISELLQQELYGLSGFSPTNLKNMRTFYEEWTDLEPYLLENAFTPLFDFMLNKNRQTASDDSNNSIRQTASDELKVVFLNVGFSHHLAIIQSIREPETRLFYLQKAATWFWTYEMLKQQLKQGLHKRINKGNHNFDRTLTESPFKQKALQTFKDEYVRQPHESPSIGIILCKETNSKIVEFALRDTTKPMGVVTYKTQNDLPEKYKKTLPKIEDLKKLL